MRGKRITTLKQIRDLAMKRKATYYAWNAYRTPAAFIFQMSGQVIMRLIERGLFEYKKEPRKSGGNL